MSDLKTEAADKELKAQAAALASEGKIRDAICGMLDLAEKELSNILPPDHTSIAQALDATLRCSPHRLSSLKSR
jgi:hypothetical protein